MGGNVYWLLIGILCKILIVCGRLDVLVDGCYGYSGFLGCGWLFVFVFENI